MSINNFEYSSKYYQDKEEYYNGTPDRIRIKKVLNLIGSNKKVLDVGCYNGEIGKKIKNGNNNVYGIDASSDAIEKAKKNGVVATVANLEERFLFEDNYFDVVFAGEILEHILDTDFFLDEIKRILKNNGELIITTPNVASLGRRIMLLFGVNPFFEASFGFPKNATAGHIRFYTKKLLIDFLNYKGFDVVKFESDTINITNKICLKFLCNIFPALGRSLIVKAIIKK